MGENAGMALEGVCCFGCGSFMGGEPEGAPMYCDSCYAEIAEIELEAEIEQK